MNIKDYRGVVIDIIILGFIYFKFEFGFIYYGLIGWFVEVVLNFYWYKVL